MKFLSILICLLSLQTSFAARINRSDDYQMMGNDFELANGDLVSQIGVVRELEIDSQDVNTSLQNPSLANELFPRESDPGYYIGIDGGTATLAVAGSLMAVIAFENDRQIMDFVQAHRNDVTSTLSTIGEHIGSDIPIITAGVGYVLGVIIKNDRVKLVSIKLSKALIYSGLITRALKMSFSRSRPSSTDDPYVFGGFDISNSNVSFPSGHTTTAFAFATVIAEEFKDHKWVPYVAYSAAALAGWSRVHGAGDGRPAHWASDVIVGALIGHIVAKKVMNPSKREGRNYIFAPSIDATGQIHVNYFYQQPNVEIPENFLFD
ncbi:MAG: hypothetical protein COV37_11665 [Bdellovibrio sp. CG11_big_fil_rev_8_21_14_0_20_39_38]|nr:MAG: hypothetical protein COW78_13595 [Bdellovibrio sp. CG22_combo_CG10-13_8_21_14_all_39_27]PIR34911.1 MAG: hypothetical protein COV37_11665 [Bdellovibrio sp. CG11_big_fil_rev_8_21_14_0_20_39_38]PJB53558.1 MAG: hypothetical protein CO099_06520 [Bdellovibrio sp. CG_4_9_14_3_um_filter_39_7]